VEAECNTGDWRVGEDCDPNPCPQPMGACCYADGSCQYVVEDECNTGDWRVGEDCDPNPCPQPMGACCYPDGTCEHVLQSDCPTEDWRTGEPCDPNPCPQPAAACCIDETCEILTEDECAASDGDWHADIDTCDPNPCINVDAEEMVDLPSAIHLYRNAPNPFRETTVIRFALPEQMRIDLRVYDLAGNCVRTLIDGAVKSPGQHYVDWDGTDDRGQRVGSGVYFYCFESGSKREARSLILLR
ncbi:MAG: hypothetical protein GF328_13540, partial [Candidatus Latescibacteria bacterium]|nr:hypothetical protein [Candidatus Latescibacterota bacterium]